MRSFWLSNLQSLFGEDRVEDALEGTALADLGREHNFGLYVVRAAIAADAAKEWMQQSTEDMATIAANAQNLTWAVAVQGTSGSRKRKLYNTVQACAGGCRCMYIYPGTARHQVYGLDQVESIKRVHQWLHGSAVVPSTHMFNEATLNVYSHEANENIPWHTDKNALYSDEMDVMAMNLGAPGIYCFAPQPQNPNIVWPELYRSNRDTWRTQAIAHGFRGMLPVLAGDLTLTTGTWHCYFLHKTLQPSRIWSDQRADLLAYYPATSAASKSLLDRFALLPWGSQVSGCDRACMTFRRIENHCNHCIYA